MSMIRLENLLKSATGDTLRDVLKRAEDMGDLTAALQSALAGETAPHLLAANLRDDGELVLLCSSPSWAARIRFESGDLLDAARKAGATSASRCSVKVVKG